MDFFNVDHVKALQVMVKHIPKEQQQASIQATSRWIENYRQSLTPEESAALKAQLLTPEGQATLRRATSQYNSQNVEYRGQTVPVISQLLKTIASVQAQ